MEQFQPCDFFLNVRLIFFFFLLGVEQMRYAVSADVSVTAGTVLQFDLSMGCQATEDCYGNTPFSFTF